MSPEDLAQRRYTLLTLLRASGVVLMLLGLWVWHGDIARAGGWPEAGAPLFFFGAFDSLMLPHLLRRRWRTPGA